MVKRRNIPNGDSLNSRHRQEMTQKPRMENVNVTNLKRVDEREVVWTKAIKKWLAKKSKELRKLSPTPILIKKTGEVSYKPTPNWGKWVK